MWVSSAQAANNLRSFFNRQITEASGAKQSVSKTAIHELADAKLLSMRYHQDHK